MLWFPSLSLLWSFRDPHPLPVITLLILYSAYILDSKNRHSGLLIFEELVLTTMAGAEYIRNKPLLNK